MIDAASAAALLDEIADRERTLYRIDREFRERANEPESAVVRAAVWMLGYRLIESSDREGRDRYGGPFAPDIELQTGVFPPYLKSLRERDDVRRVWSELAARVRAPAIRARLGDLLWCVDQSEGRHQHAGNAVDSYISAAEAAGCGEPHPAHLLDCVCGLARALELSRQVNDPQRVRRVRDVALQLVMSELENDDARSRPGIWMRLLVLLAGLDADERPEDLGKLLSHAHGLADRPNTRLSLFQLEERLVRGQPETERIQQASVEMLIEHALQQDGGLSRAHWLREAFELARGKGWASRKRSGIEQCILRELQRIDPASYDWQEASSEVALPDKQVETWLDAIVGDDDLGAALDRFALAGGSPVGDRTETERLVDEMAPEFVLMNLANHNVIDEHGYTTRHAGSAEEKRELDILEHEADAVRWDAELRRLALDRIAERYASEGAGIDTLFQTELIDKAQSEALARSFAHYWADRPDEALLVALPRIEAVLRNWLDKLGGVIYEPPRGDRPGQTVSLGGVLHELERLSADEMAVWWRYFRIALVMPVPGLNLRNRHVHGLAGAATKADAVVALRIAALFRVARVLPN